MGAITAAIGVRRWFAGRKHQMVVRDIIYRKALMKCSFQQHSEFLIKHAEIYVASSLHAIN